MGAIGMGEWLSFVSELGAEYRPITNAWNSLFGQSDTKCGSGKQCEDGSKNGENTGAPKILANAAYQTHRQNEAIRAMLNKGMMVDRGGSRNPGIKQ